MISKTIVQLFGYLCVAGVLVEAVIAPPTCSSSQPCPSNMKCYTSSYCQTGYCLCSNSGSVMFNSTTCVTPSVLVGGNCTDNSQCMGSYTSCSSNVCTCSAGYNAKSDNTDCMAATKLTLGSNCSTSAIPPQCGAYASCVSSGPACQCSAGYVASSNNIDCRAVTLGDMCTNTTTCPTSSSATACNNGNCNSNTYQCNTGYSWVSSITPPFMNGCYSNVSATVGVGQNCSYTWGSSNYNQLCSSGLTCTFCPESPTTFTCQNVATTTATTTAGPGGPSKGGAPNVRFDIVALVTLALLQLA